MTEGCSKDAEGVKGSVFTSSLKILILSGFLGSGKTTLLLQLARYLINLDYTQQYGLQERVNPASSAKSIKTTAKRIIEQAPVAIIENEIGEFSIDSNSLVELNLQISELLNGCACCSLAGDLMAGIQKIQEQIKPCWLIIEATGLAAANEMSKQIRQWITGVHSITTITLADATRLALLFKVAKPLMVRQLESADIVLLTKVDIASARQKQEALEMVRSVNPVAPIYATDATQEIGSDLFAALRVVAESGCLSAD